MDTPQIRELIETQLSNLNGIDKQKNNTRFNKYLSILADACGTIIPKCGIVIDGNTINEFLNAFSEKYNSIYTRSEINNNDTILDCIEPVEAKIIADNTTTATDLATTAQLFASSILTQAIENFNNPKPTNNGDDDPETKQLNKAKAIMVAETIINSHTMANEAGLKQRKEAMDIIRSIIENGACDKIETPEEVKIYQHLLMSGKSKDNILAVQSILCKYTTLKSYVTEDKLKEGERYPLNGTHLRRVSETNTVSGGVEMPAGSNTDESTVMWDKAVLAAFGKTIPVFNANAEEIQTILSKETSFLDKTIAVNKIRAELRDVGINGTIKIFDALKNFKEDNRRPISISPLIIEATDEFMTTVSSNVSVNALAMSRHNPAKAVKVDNLDLGFIFQFYKALSPTAGANEYVAISKKLALKHNGTYGVMPFADLAEFKKYLEEHGKPPFFIMTPSSQLKFHEAAIESLATNFLALAGSAYHLVSADLPDHKCILVLTDKLMKALFWLK